MIHHNEINFALPDKSLFTRKELKDYIRAKNPALKDSSFSWLLYDLCQKRIIQRIAHDVYQKYEEGSLLKNYTADMSADTVNILGFLKTRFPLITFIIWETRAFNEFANHQMARNFIFIEVEKQFDESVFNALHEKNNYTVLYRPRAKELALYSGNITVSVLPITSEAPISGYYARLEKLLVDLFANELLDLIISRSDFPGIYEEAFSKYNINYNMMIRYAKRRGKDEKIESFINSETTINVYRKEKVK